MPPKTYEFAHATVQYTENHSLATGKVMPRLYVQVIDAYSYQRELTVEYRHEPGDSKNLYWEYHIYRHPGRRRVEKVSQKVATAFIERFLHLCEDYPVLLFNEGTIDRPRSDGFVRLAERLHDGEKLSAGML